MKISDAEISSLLFDEQASDPATPGAGLWRAFFKAGGLYIIDAAGAVTGPFSAGGAVATDAIYDAKGDLPVGTGANAAAKLAIGTDGQVLTADSGESTGVKWSTPTAFGGGAEPVAGQRTAGNVSTTSTAFVAVDASTDLVIPGVVTGDWVDLQANLWWENQVAFKHFTWASIVSGSVVNYVNTGASAGFGIPGFGGFESVESQVAGTFRYQLQSGDISGGSAVFRALFKSSNGTSVTMRANSNQPFRHTGRLLT